jgi:hypothetical protein
MHRLIAPVSLALAALALPSAAGAAALTVPSGCYLSEPSTGVQPISFTASGLAPGQQTTNTLSIAGTAAGSAPFSADGAGNIANRLTWSALPAGPSRPVSATLTLTDAATGAPLATAPVTLGSIGLKINAQSLQSVSSKRKWQVSGLSQLTGKKTYTAFFFKKSSWDAGKRNVLGHQKLGKASGPCGYLSVKKPLTPFKKTGTFIVAVQTNGKYRSADPAVLSAVQTFKTFL